MGCVQAFAVFNLVIEHLADDAADYAPGILQLLPQVWESARGQSLLRIQARPSPTSLANLKTYMCPPAQPTSRCCRMPHVRALEPKLPCR